MSEQQETSTIAPSDSASAKSRRRPGKQQRQQQISQAGSTTAPTSMTKASMFASRAFSAPVPQPGKYPVVFPTGAGEPEREEFFHLDGNSLAACFTKVTPDLINSSRFAEFSTHAEYSDEGFHRELVCASLLSVAQQVVHAHQNIGFSIGDLSSVATTDTYLPASVAAIVRQFGEFSVESLGTKFVLPHYESEVKALIRDAQRVLKTEDDTEKILQSHWHPVESGDKRTSFIIAVRLSQHFKRFGLTLDVDLLKEDLFSGNLPSYFAAAKAVLPEADRTVFDVLFHSYDSENAFAALFPAGNGTTRLFALLGLKGFLPSAMGWNIQPKMLFPNLLMGWLRKAPTIKKFFTCSSGLLNRAVTTGSPVQLSTVSKHDGVTVVRALLGVPASDFSLLACYPASAVVPPGRPFNVVLTTSIAIAARATEFVQRDWVG